MLHFQVGVNGFCLSSFYIVKLVHHRVSNISIYRQIQEIFNQVDHVLINLEGYCEKSKYTPFMNLF